MDSKKEIQWMDKEVFHLLQLYKKHECLWLKSSPDRSKKYKRALAIANIAAELQCTEQDVISKIKGLRSSYTRYCKISRGNAAGDDDYAKKPWKYYSAMNFLYEGNEYENEYSQFDESSLLEDQNNAPTPTLSSSSGNDNNFTSPTIPTAATPPMVNLPSSTSAKRPCIECAIEPRQQQIMQFPPVQNHALDEAWANSVAENVKYALMSLAHDRSRFIKAISKANSFVSELLLDYANSGGCNSFYPPPQQSHVKQEEMNLNVEHMI